MLQEMWRLHREGGLEGSQRLMMQSHRPPEELYDTQSDPWEINNLAGDPSHQETLERMRAALEDWRQEVGDMGEVSEDEMVDSRWPNHEQPRTGVPTFIPYDDDHIGMEPSPDGKSLMKAPGLLQMHCATQGASIGYTFEQGDDAHWLLYSAPLRLDPGTCLVRAKAIRVGYEESDERVATFVVT